VDILGQETQDPDLLAYCAAHDCVWVTTDEQAMGNVTEWLGSGKELPGVVIVPQRHQLTPGRLCGSSNDSHPKKRRCRCHRFFTRDEKQCA
jgi:hypothetical protein